MKRPLMVLAAVFVLGEALALQYQAVAALGLLLAFVLAAAGCYVYWQGREASLRLLMPFFILLFAGAVLGFGRGALEKRKMDHEEKQLYLLQEDRVRVKGRIRKIEEKQDKQTLILEKAEIRKGDTLRECTNLLVYTNTNTFKGLEDVSELAVGKQAEFAGTLNLKEEPGNPGEFHFKMYCRSKGSVCSLFAEKLIKAEGEAVPYYSLLRNFRLWCREKLNQTCEERDSRIYQAMLLGDSSAVEPEMKEMYQQNGIAHLLAISGQHLSIVGGGIYWLLRKGGMRQKGAGAIGAVLVVSYAVMTGSSGSAMRAVVMILCMWLAAAAGRTYDMLSGLSLAALVLLWEQPYLLTQCGFQLSFGAVLAIGGLSAPLGRLLKIERPWPKTVLVSLCVQVVITPVVLWHYFEHPLYGILMNLLVLPFVPIMMCSGILAIGMGGLWTPLGRAAAGAGHYILEYDILLCRTAEKLPGYNLVLGRPAWWQIGAYGFCLAFLFVISRYIAGKKKQEEQTEKSAVKKLAAAVCIYGISFLWLLPMPAKGLKVLCMDVGQGDGFLLRTGFHSLLVDGGSNSRKDVGPSVLETCLKSQGLTRLDYGIVSHGDEDHINGLLYLLEESEDIKINTLILPAMGKGQEVYSRLEKSQTNRGGNTVYMKTGDKIKAGDLELTCIYGGEKQAGSGQTSDNSKDRNSHSLVLCADYKEFHMLFTGDMGERQERELLKLEEMGGSRGIQKEHLNHSLVLKIAHHGSSGSSGKAFLDRIPFQIAVVSYGKGNSYGHPSEEVMEAIKQRRIPVWETGVGGAVLIRTDGRTMRVGYFKKSDPEE